MSEKKAFRNSLIKLSIICLFAICYSLGGMYWKPLRRFIAPTILCTSMFYFSKDWRSIIQLPFMFLSLSLGYGADNLFFKIVKRCIFGLANGITSSGHNILKKKWLLVGTQIILVAGLFIVMGVWNPLTDARTEELLLGLIIPLIPLFSVKEKENET